MKRITFLMMATFATVLTAVAQDKPLSPSATVEGKIGAANVKIVYCQPSELAWLRFELATLVFTLNTVFGPV